MTQGAQQASVRAAADTEFQPAVRPTIYLFGVSTADSLMMSVFPRWVEYLTLGQAEIRAVDCEMHAQPEVYRKFLRFLAADPLSSGAMVTNHNTDLLHAGRDLFASLEPYATASGQVSSISKRQGKLAGHAKEPVTTFSALEAFLPAGHWMKTAAQALILGAGASAVALASAVMNPRNERNRPSRIIVSERSRTRLQEIHHVHKKAAAGVPTEYHCITDASQNDALLSGLKPGSLVVNATGLGKDAPGSPFTPLALFPEHGFAWDLNFRGALDFLEQARNERESRSLHVEDGWTYFVNRWTRVIADVFAIDIPSTGPVFAELSRIAREASQI